MKFKFHDADQSSQEWLDMRAGLATSSKLAVVMANFGKAFGQPAKDYANKIALEKVTGKTISSDYSNAHMERGVAQEPIACALYEDEKFCTVTNGGFFENGFLGASPDGLVGDDGLIEIKSVIYSVQFKNIIRNSVDPAYKWQCIGNLYFTGRDWIEFVSYCADFPEDNQLFIHRMVREDYTEEFKMIDERTGEFLELVNKSIKLLKELG